MRRNQATSIEHRYGTAQAATYSGGSQVERTQIGGTQFAQSVLGVVSSTDPSYGTRHYVRTPDGRVLAEYRASQPAGQQWRYYLTNHQGSIAGGTNEAGWRTESYGYGAYGEYQYGSGGGTNLIHWRYTGQWQDGTFVSGNGYTKIGLRYYDNHLGRWTQTDQLIRVVNPDQPSESNPYNYSGSNPVDQTDPSGAWSWGCFWGYVSAGATGVGMVASAVAAPFSGPAAPAAVLATRASYVGFVATTGGLAAGGCFPWQSGPSGDGGSSSRF